MADPSDTSGADPLRAGLSQRLLRPFPDEPVCQAVHRHLVRNPDPFATIRERLIDTRASDRTINDVGTAQSLALVKISA
ncbi:hypothetical protein [Rhodococcus sp. LB1]|uniref:hypothetical protein n=1 Tax=Rhodococcus sp. LB1 TaxID=1807499 RepID=UPI0007988C5F|nr:hypothetical protein [Rhodococcus sp. LB1]KXX60300.1 hypothetical protein AZG88_38190 [Rhodococcus sp. LB1]